MIAFFAALGFGSIVAAGIGWFVAVSNHRQAWIDALRDDLATYLKHLEIIHHAVSSLLACTDADKVADFETQKQTARIDVLFCYRRILLRLNRTEPIHVELAAKLDELMRVQTRVPDAAKVEVMVDVARRLLKQEWEVAKWGPLAPQIRKWREYQRSRSASS